MNKSNLDIEQLVDLFDKEDKEAIDKDKIEDFLKDEENHANLCLLKDIAEILARQNNSCPDIDKEWDKFKKRKSSTIKEKNNFYVLATLIGVAACILFLFIIYNKETTTLDKQNNTIVFKASNSEKNILLKSENGITQEIGSLQTDSLLTTQGIKIGDNSIDLKNSKKEEIQTLIVPRGKDFKVILADGTEVWLNAESKLSYPSKFTSDTRLVTLEGEAYFNVAKDKARPFIVKTNKLQTKVLGTEFNVKAYDKDKQHITLVEGKVQVNCVLSKKEIELKPGQDASLDEDGSIVVKNVDTYKYTQWKDGYFYFDNIALSEIVQELGRWYNIDIEFENSSMLGYHLHFVADRNNALPQVLENLNALQKVEALLIDNKLIIR